MWARRHRVPSSSSRSRAEPVRSARSDNGSEDDETVACLPASQPVRPSVHPPACSPASLPTSTSQPSIGVRCREQPGSVIFFCKIMHRRAPTSGSPACCSLLFYCLLCLSQYLSHGRLSALLADKFLSRTNTRSTTFPPFFSAEAPCNCDKDVCFLAVARYGSRGSRQAQMNFPLDFFCSSAR